jgi:two-component system, LytTR family, response regulator LytT
MIRTIAIDDEPLALKLVEGYIKKIPFLDFFGVYENPLQAIESIKQHEIDLVFLDIQMPDLSGIDFVKKLNNEAKIIFTTAFEQYAVEGFRLEAIDYLVKPFSYEEFLLAAKKAQKQIELEQKALLDIDANNDFLFIKSEYKIRRINFDDILYVEGLKDYVKVFLKSDPKPVLSINSLKALEAKLPETKFMRVHRSFIVNLRSITTIERSRIVYGKVFIPVTDQYKEKFQEFLNKNCL